MAPREEESLPLIGDYGTGGGGSKMKRVSSIAEELGPMAQTGKASRLNVGINLAKTAGKKERKKERTIIVVCHLPLVGSPNLGFRRLPPFKIENPKPTNSCNKSSNLTII